MSKYWHMAILLGLAVMLAACAPGVKRSNVSNAFNLSRDDVVVTPGASYYLKIERSPALLGVTIPDLSNQQMREAAEGKRFRQRVGSIQASQIGLPSGWDFKLHSTSGIVEITDVKETGSRISVAWTEKVELVFVMTVPASTTADTFAGMISASGPGNKTAAIPFTVKVVNSQ